jgi:multiple sugar transport system permease protein
MATYLFNSAKIAILSVIGMCVSSSLAAFAFARMRFRGKNLIFGILLGTMMIPYATTVIPTFVIFRLLGWINTHAPLIVPNFFGSAYFVFLLRQSYLGIPQDFMDAAEMDGAGFFYIYSRIFIPLGMPMLTTVAVLQFLGSWNDLFGPLIYLNDQMKMTVQIGLTYLRGRAGTGVEHVGIVMAGSLMGILPMLLLYSFGQKYFVKGLARAGLKG